MPRVRIYVEGGGDEDATKAKVRSGFRDLFREFEQWRVRPSVIACGSRGNAYRDFVTATGTHPDDFVVLLVDAERPVTLPPKEHLSERPDKSRNPNDPRDGWDLAVADDDQIHLMVQAVEAWLIADPAAMEKHFGPQFSSNALPRRPNPEDIPKEELKGSIDAAAKSTPKRGYSGTRDCPKILGLVDPRVVRAKCSACRRLFDVISSVTGTPPLP